MYRQFPPSRTVVVAAVLLVACALAWAPSVSAAPETAGVPEAAVNPALTLVEAAAQQGSADTLVCHRRGKNGFHPLYVNENAVPGHREHGDGLPGEAFPGIPGHEFGEDCTAVLSSPPLQCPCFQPLTEQELLDRANAYTSLTATRVQCRTGKRARAAYITSGPNFVAQVNVGSANQSCRLRDDINGVSKVVAGPADGSGNLSDEELAICRAEVEQLVATVEWCQ